MIYSSVVGNDLEKQEQMNSKYPLRCEQNLFSFYVLVNLIHLCVVGYFQRRIEQAFLNTRSDLFYHHE